MLPQSLLFRKIVLPFRYSTHSPDVEVRIQSFSFLSSFIFLFSRASTPYPSPLFGPLGTPKSLLRDRDGASSSGHRFFHPRGQPLAPFPRLRSNLLKQESLSFCDEKNGLLLGLTSFSLIPQVIDPSGSESFPPFYRLAEFQPITRLSIFSGLTASRFPLTTVGQLPIRPDSPPPGYVGIFLFPLLVTPLDGDLFSPEDAFHLQDHHADSKKLFGLSFLEPPRIVGDGVSDRLASF